MRIQQDDMVRDIEDASMRPGQAAPDEYGQRSLALGGYA